MESFLWSVCYVRVGGVGGWSGCVLCEGGVSGWVPGGSSLV